MKRGDAELKVDVLRSVTGLTITDLMATESIVFANGKSYTIPAPEIMLKAKLANLAAHDQTGRQDERHVRILVRCCGHYLSDVFAAIREQELSERDAVDRFMATYRIISEKRARSLDGRFSLGLSSAIPATSSLDSLEKLPRLNAFYRHQIPSR